MRLCPGETPPDALQGPGQRGKAAGSGRKRERGNKKLVPSGVTWRLEGQTGGSRGSTGPPLRICVRGERAGRRS